MSPAPRPRRPGIIRPPRCRGETCDRLQVSSCQWLPGRSPNPLQRQAAASHGTASYGQIIESDDDLRRPRLRPGRRTGPGPLALEPGPRACWGPACQPTQKSLYSTVDQSPPPYDGYQTGETPGETPEPFLKGNWNHAVTKAATPGPVGPGHANCGGRSYEGYAGSACQIQVFLLF
jgi:hypothetical protein